MSISIIRPFVTPSPRTFDAIVAPSGGDYTNIKTALDAGNKNIFVKNGTYGDGTENIVIASGTAILGESLAAQINYTLSSPTIPVTNLFLENLSFKSIQITAVGNSNIRLTNCQSYVASQSNGIRNTTGLYLNGCTNTTGVSWSLDSSYIFLYLNTDLYISGGDLFSGVVFGNTLGYTAWGAATSKLLVIDSNYLIGGYFDLYTDSNNAGTIILKNNKIKDSSSFGIGYSPSGGYGKILIDGNEVINPAAEGIKLFNGTNNARVVNNYIDTIAASTYGIYVGTGTKLDISHNTLLNITTSGYELYDGATATQKIGNIY